MKTLKSLLLGSAGAAVLLAAGTVAQAADAPKAAKGKEPVYRCDTPGFIEYPGSDVCFKIGGAVHAWIQGVSDNQAAGFPAGASPGSAGGGAFVPWGFGPSNFHTMNDTMAFGTQAIINLDVRQATQYGIVRVFIELAAYDDAGNDGGPANLRHGFIQVGNWLMGKTWSTFFAGGMWPEYFGIGNHLVPLGVPLVRNNQVRYTASLAPGTTVSIAIEDPARYDAAGASGLGGVAVPGVIGAVASRNEMPDIVANIATAGSWGRAQLSVAAHQYSYMDGIGMSHRPWTWAIMAAAVFNVPSMGKDTIHVQLGYTEGFQAAFTTHGATFSILQVAGGATFLTDSFVVVAGYRHFWSDTLRSSIGVSYWDHDYDPAVVIGTDRDTVMMVWGNLIWTPVPRLDLGVEVMYGRAKTVAGVRTTGWGGTVQASRSF